MFRFEEFVLDTGAGALFRGDEEILLRPQSYAVLLHLVKNQGQLVTREELLGAVWPGKVVTDASITQCLVDIRAALDDSSHDKIRTVTRRGYRFELDVHREGGATDAPGPASTLVDRQAQRPDAPSDRRAPSKASGPRRLAAVAAVALVVVVVVIVVLVLADRRAVTGGQAEEPVLAVLPFRDISPEGDQQYFADGVAEELQERLTRLEGLKTVSRVFAAELRSAGDGLDPAVAALDATVLLDGSVRKGGDRIRVSTQLIDVESGEPIWSETYERELEDIFAIQDDIAEKVAGALGVSLGVGDVNAFLGAGTRSVEAYEAYLRGVATPFFSQSSERLRQLKRATDLDSNYAAAWAALGLSTAGTTWLAPVEETPAIIDRAVHLLRRAVELAPDSAYAYTLLATVSYPKLDWVASERNYRRALEILPDGELHHHYSNFLMRTGRSEESLRHAQLEFAAVRNPGWRKTNFNAALALGRLDELRTGEARATLPGPGSPDLLLALNSGDSALLARAMEGLETGDGVDLNFVRAIRIHLSSPRTAVAMLRAFLADANAQWPSKYHDIALFAAFFGDHELALEAMGHEARLITIRYGALWYPVLSDVRRLPGFKQLVEDVNLVQYWRTFEWPDHCRPVAESDFECF